MTLTKIPPSVKFHNLNIIEYKEAWDIQERFFSNIISSKSLNRNQTNKNNDIVVENHLIFCEHPHVYTLGKNGSINNLLLDHIQLQAKNATFFQTNRGGDITYHGPGQLVGYPIFDLELFSLDIRRYIYLIEESIIMLCRGYQIETTRLDGATGVWIDIDNSKARKICAIGVRASRYVTMHGFALNINTDLSYFGHINPCGFTDKSVTSIAKELGRPIDFDEVSMRLKEIMSNLFNFSYL